MTALPLRIERHTQDLGTPQGLARLRDLLGVPLHASESFAAAIPFSVDDTTAGTENELQTAVVGDWDSVDLPLTIEASNYFNNIMKRARAGETSKRVVTDLEAFVRGNRENVWDHSWVRIPYALLRSDTEKRFQMDLLANKRDPTGPKRSDADRFLIRHRGEPHLRVPVSYLLKLALVDVIGTPSETDAIVRETGERIIPHFLNDNTSPETFSFHPVLLRSQTGLGSGLARETLKRFLLTHLLAEYANERFELRQSGQTVSICFSPHPPVRLQKLNCMVPDGFYRELFMSPCLCGWDRGEEKYRYMVLCHQVLSRSQLNAVSKLREAGIIVNNLVVLPNTSNVSLANNGTHISLGSRKLTHLCVDENPDFLPEHEKYLGDLVIKVVEHFLPMFVGTCSGAPYRIDFRDFHPEKVMGFLPHELDYTHLRMLWRRWRKKAKLKVLGQPVTPFGPRSIDYALSLLFRLKGDFVQDFRLIDYLVSLMSTDESPALDGTLGNDERLKRDLSDMGVFDPDMALYLLYRLRLFSKNGFCGFEGRHYSQFESLMGDMADAASLQALVTALAFHYILSGRISHAHIPDGPVVESERRQIFFGAAIGIPTFFVHHKTRNRFLMRILKQCERTRMSRRYPGYVRVYNREYCKALVRILKEDAAELIELMDLRAVMDRLENRINLPETDSAAGRLTRGILGEAGATNPMKLSGDEFNLAAEKYYRTTLKRKHIEEALTVLEEDAGCFGADSHPAARGNGPGCGADRTVGDVRESLRSARRELLQDRVPIETSREMIRLLLRTIHTDIHESRKELSAHREKGR